MFVFKAAVVGAGTMGGQIAQTIAAAGIDVVLKDVKQELVDHGLTEARNVTEGQVGRLVSKEKITEEQGKAQVEEVVGRIQGTLTYDDFGDVDLVIEAVPEKMEIKQAVFSELDAVTPGHAILASNTSSLSITEIGDATLRPEKVVGFHYFYPAAVMPLIEIVRGDETSAGDHRDRAELRPGDQEAADRLRGGPRLRRQPDPELRRVGDLACAGRAGSIDQGDRRGRRRGQRRSHGPVLPRRPARPRHRLPRRRAPQRVLWRSFLRPQGHGKARRRGQARRQDRRLGLLRQTASPSSRATAPTSTASSSAS